MKKRTTLGVVALALALTAGVAVVAINLLHSDLVRSEHLLALGRDRSLLALEVTTPRGDLIWSIENPSSVRTAEIDYGMLPPGFMQNYPVASGPRVLDRKEQVVWTAVYSPDGFMRVNSRFAGETVFLHGLTVSGPTCGESRCLELFRLPPKLALNKTSRSIP